MLLSFTPRHGIYCFHLIVILLLIPDQNILCNGHDAATLSSTLSSEHHHESKKKMQLESEVQRFDGWYNNLAHPSWGSLGMQSSCVLQGLTVGEMSRKEMHDVFLMKQKQKEECVNFYFSAVLYDYYST